MPIICTLRSATDAQLARLLKAPDQLEDFLEDEEDFGDPAGAGFLELDLDTSWHGIHFLLTGTASEGHAPLDFLERGGREVGDVDLGYGPARAFLAAQVQAIHAALEQVDDAELAHRYDPQRMRMLEIHPDIWDRPAEEGDPLAELLSYLGELRRFLARVSERGHGMLVYLT